MKVIVSCEVIVSKGGSKLVLSESFHRGTNSKFKVHVRGGEDTCGVILEA